MKTVKSYLALICAVCVLFTYSVPAFGSDSHKTTELIRRGNAANAGNASQAQNPNPAPNGSGQKFQYDVQETVAPGPEAGSEYMIKSNHFSVTVPGINDPKDITPAEKETLINAAAMFASLDSRVDDEHAEQEDLKRQLDAAPDFDTQIQVLKSWYDDEIAKGRVVNSETKFEELRTYAAEYHLPDKGDPDWYNPDGTPKKLIYSSDWGKSKVDQTFHGRAGLADRTSIEQNGGRVVDDSKPVILKIMQASAIPQQQRLQMRERINEAIQNPGDHRYVSESEELPGSVEDPCLVPIELNYGHNGVAHNEIYDKCHDPKHEPPIKGISIATDAVKDANGNTVFPARTYWIAEICTNPVVIRQTPGTLRVQTSLGTLKGPALTPGGKRLPPTKGGTTPGSAETGRGPAPEPVVPEMDCMARDAEHLDQTIHYPELRAGKEYGFDLEEPWRVEEGTFKVTREDKNKKSELGPSSVTIQDNGTAIIIRNVPKGKYLIEFQARNHLNGHLATHPCRIGFEATKEGGRVLAFVIGFGGGVLVGCVVWGPCLPSGGKSGRPKTANDNNGPGVPPGRTGRR